MVYLHVPFCRSFCTYCSFYSETCSKSRQDTLFSEYAGAVVRETEERSEEIRNNPFRTIYIGGGTPSVLPLDVLSRIVSGIRNAQDGEPLREFTIEVNPEDIVEKGEEYVAGLLSLGVSRISMGIQSFDDGILRWMNRRHDSERAVRAYSIIRRTAQEARKDVDVSIDLIFGLSQLDESTWDRTLTSALALGRDEGFRTPDHISAYQLSIEEGSALEEMAARGDYSEASEEVCARQYSVLCDRLKEAGYSHYEVSNFALPGHEAVHNSAYWTRIPYVGLGPGAHSLTVLQTAEGRREIRSWNTQVLPGRGMEAYTREVEELSPEDVRIERIMLALRTAAGIGESDLRSLAGEGNVDSFLKDGLLERKGNGCLRIPESHFFVSDEIIRELV